MEKKQLLINELSWRGLIKDISHEENLEAIIKDKKNFYVGIDPTADSLHLGHYISIVISHLFNKITGMKPIFVLGVGTGQIGDPSGKFSEREVILESIVQENANAIKKQIAVLAKNLGLSNYSFFNNNDIYKNLSISDFFRIYGKNFNLNTMIKKESVQNRLETGISYTEFSYQVFQAVDFWTLFDKYNVSLQIGGSDQWGNITAGIDLIKKMAGSNVKISGITINLLLDENGNKIGKTSGNPIWLNGDKFSAYQLFQYVINLSDQMVENLLPKLTLINQEEYKLLVKKHKEDSSKKFLQNKFAEILITNIHSNEQYQIVKNISKSLFEENYQNLTTKEIDVLSKLLPTVSFKKEKLIDFVIESKLLSSKRIYREFLNSNSIKINGKLISKEDYIFEESFLIEDKFLILNLGKKKKYLIKKDNF